MAMTSYVPDPHPLLPCPVLSITSLQNIPLFCFITIHLFFIFEEVNVFSTMTPATWHLISHLHWLSSRWRCIATCVRLWPRSAALKPAGLAHRIVLTLKALQIKVASTDLHPRWSDATLLLSCILFPTVHYTGSWQDPLLTVCSCRVFFCCYCFFLISTVHCICALQCVSFGWLWVHTLKIIFELIF